MTNREKAINYFMEWIKTLDNEMLAYVLAFSVDDLVEMGCQHCIYIVAKITTAAAIITILAGTA